MHYVRMDELVLAYAAAAITPNTTCSGDEWQCADGGCVAADEKCDDELNCWDGSDEALLLCQGTKRPMFGLILHCSSPWAARSPGVCPDICPLDSTFCYYALLAATGAAGTCKLPQFPNNGMYLITELDKDKTPGLQPADFSLHFACDLGRALVGDSTVRCENGTWSTDFPHCVEACQLHINKTAYSYNCSMGSRPTPCGEFVPAGSLVSVQRKQSAGGAALVSCAPGGSFNVSKKCIAECAASIESFEIDTMEKLKKYKGKMESTDDKSRAFEELVKEFEQFQKRVNDNSTELVSRVGECEIHLELLSASQRIGHGPGWNVNKTKWIA